MAECRSGELCECGARHTSFPSLHSFWCPQFEDKGNKRAPNEEREVKELIRVIEWGVAVYGGSEKRILFNEERKVKARSLDQLAAIATEHNWSPLLKGPEHGNPSTSVLVIEVDRGLSMIDAIARIDSVICGSSCAVITTKRHRSEPGLEKARERYRILIPLAAPIEDEEVYNRLWEKVAAALETNRADGLKYWCDVHCKDWGKIYYKGREIVSVRDEGKHLSAEALLGRPKAPNSNRVVCCPFHGEKTPSLYIYDDHFHCFGCKAHGPLSDLPTWQTND